MKKSGFTFLLALLLFHLISYSQKEKTALLKDVSIQYWDSETQGDPLIFIHSDSRDGSQFNEFSKAFTKTNRVITYSRRGYGKSKSTSAEMNHDVDTEDLLELMKFLKIKKAVFAGNSYAGFIMTKLAENHENRVKAQIYLAGNPGAMFRNIIKADSLEAYKMVFWAQGGEDYANTTIAANLSFRPDYVEKGKKLPSFPALGFLNQENTRGLENSNLPLIYLNMVEEIDREVPSGFFRQIARDSSMIEKLINFDLKIAKPLLRKDSELWVKSFPNLEIINLDLPMITGYEYERNPELIEPHIKDFLGKL